MAVLANPRCERVAQFLARGFSKTQSALRAGYANLGGWLCRKIRSEAFQARLAEILATLDWGGTPDVAPVINALARIALAAEAKGFAGDNPGWVKIAIDGLKAVAELKSRLPEDPYRHAEPVRPPPRELTIEEWSERYGATIVDAPLCGAAG